MDFRLKVFVSVARHLSFTRAAKELQISQPAITKHIQELENMYGVQLFRRIGIRIALTHHGSILLRHAKEILERYRVLENEMLLLSGKFDGELRIGAESLLAQGITAHILADFMCRFPDVKVSFISGTACEIADALEAEKLDLAFVTSELRRENLSYSVFAKEKLLMITSAQNTYLPEFITAEDLLKLPVVLCKETLHEFESLISGPLADAKLAFSDLNVKLRMETSAEVKSFLTNYAQCCAMIPEFSVLKELESGELKSINVKDMEVYRELSIATPMYNGKGNSYTRAKSFASFVANRLKCL